MRKGGYVAAVGVISSSGDAGLELQGSRADGGCAAGNQATVRHPPSPALAEDSVVSLKDYKGKYVVLYFYPKDMTSGCTIEAHNFERDTGEIRRAQCRRAGREPGHGREPQDLLHQGRR